MICATQYGGGDGRWRLMDDLFGWRIIDCKPGIGGVVLSGCQGEEVEVRDVGIERVVEGRHSICWILFWRGFENVDAIMDVMSGAGCIRVCRSEGILQGCDSIMIEVESIGLTRCIYGHKGNY